MSKAKPKSRLKARNDKIRQQYRKEFGKGYRHAVVLQRLADRWYLSESTIEQIVQGRDGRG